MSQVTHNERAGRFEMTVDGQTGFLQYRTGPGNRIELIHTEVPRELEGRGLGGSLARRALDHARSAGLEVTATCAFVRRYLERHPEYADLTK